MPISLTYNYASFPSHRVNFILLYPVSAYFSFPLKIFTQDVGGVILKIIKTSIGLSRWAQNHWNANLLNFEWWCLRTFLFPFINLSCIWYHSRANKPSHSSFDVRINRKWFPRVGKCHKNCEICGLDLPNCIISRSQYRRQCHCQLPDRWQESCPEGELCMSGLGPSKAWRHLSASLSVGLQGRCGTWEAAGSQSSLPSHAAAVGFIRKVSFVTFLWTIAIFTMSWIFNSFHAEHQSQPQWCLLSLFDLKSFGFTSALVVTSPALCSHLRYSRSNGLNN